MVSRVVFWSCFGVAVRWWQLGLEMRPFFQRKNLWTYPAFAAGFGSFGYWLQGVSERQTKYLDERKKELVEKRARKLARDSDGGEAAA